MKWWRKLRGKVRLAEPLKNYTTFKIGGPANFFIEPKDANDLKLLLNLAKRYNLPIFVMGRGSNLLISDKGINGVVARLNAPYFNKLSCKDNCLNAGSGVSLNRVVLFAKERGLSGVEFLAGIPGTVGGALAMNAGIVKKIPAKGGSAYGGKNQKSPPQRMAGPPISPQRMANPPSILAEILAERIKNIGDLAEAVTAMDYNGKIKTLYRKDIEFGYRTSNLSKYIILSALIRLRKENKGQISDKIRAYLEYRKLTQDLSKPSAGCIFRNPTGYSAGRLIDLCGLKGKRVGGAGVSVKHANFILNLGRGNSQDVIKLMGLIREKVSSKFKISLTPEIKIWQN